MGNQAVPRVGEGLGSAKAPRKSYEAGPDDRRSVERLASRAAIPAVISFCLFVILGAAGLSPRAAAVDMSSDPIDEVRPLTQKEETDLAATRVSLEEARKRLLTEQLSDEQKAAVRKKISEQSATLQALEQRQQAWRAYAAVGSKPDPDKCFMLFKRFEALEHRYQYDAAPPAISEWESLASELTPYGAASMMTGDNVPYATRARRLAGECYIYIAVTLSKKGASVGEVLRPYVKGVRIFDTVARGAGRPEGQPPARLPTEHRARVDIEDTEQAVSMLAKCCPWGVPLFMMMADAGYTADFDCRILQPFGATEKICEVPLKDNIPPSVEEEIAAVVSGKFEYLGKPVSIEWLRPPKVTYSMWFVSPSAYNMSTGEITKWLMRGVKLLKAGPGDLLADELMDFLVQVIGRQYGEQDSVYGTSALIVDANNFGVIDSDFLIDRKPTLHFKVSKETALKCMAYFEKKELEYLWENIDPKNKEVLAQTGQAKSYDGSSPFPQVMIRADVLGFEKMPDVRYSRVWQVVQYYQLDPRPLAGSASAIYDLGDKRVLAALPSASGQGTGRITDRAYWKRLPSTPKSPLGQRLYLTDFTPKGQRIIIKVSPRQLEKWAAALGGYGELCGVLSGPAADRRAASTIYAEYRLTQGEMAITIINENNTLGGKLAVLYDAKGILYPTSADRMFNEYEFTVRGRRKTADTRSGPMFEYGPDIATHKIQMHGKPGRPVRGAITDPAPGVVELVYNLDEPFELEPRGTTGDLLPPAIFVATSNINYGGTVKSVSTDREVFKLTALVGPVPPGGHELKVMLGSRTLTLRGATTQSYAAAAFAADLPLAAGTNRIILTAAGADPVEFSVARSVPTDREKRLSELRATFDRDYNASQQAKHGQNAYDYYSRGFHALRDALDLAEEYIAIAQYDNAKGHIEFVLTNTPAEDQVKQANVGLEHLTGSTTARAKQLMSQVAFFRCDAAAMRTNGMEWLDADRRTAEAATSPPSSYFYKEQAGAYATLYRRYTSIADDPAGAREILAHYERSLRKAGTYDGARDAFDLRLSEEALK